MIDIIRVFEKHHFSVNWKDISSDPTLTDTFIRVFKNYLNWEAISEHQVLSEAFISEFKDYVDWGCISKHQQLTVDFKYKFQDRVKDWETFFKKS